MKEEEEKEEEEEEEEEEGKRRKQCVKINNIQIALNYDYLVLIKCIIDVFQWKKRELYCLFVGYKKAFDTVWREGLWWTLVRHNVNVYKVMYIIC